jgi:hypothetical protein
MSIRFSGVLLASLVLSGCPSELDPEPTPGPAPGNQRPTSRIIDPSARDNLDDLVPVQLRGRISDPEDTRESLSVVWSSDVDGELQGEPVDDGGVVVAEVLLSAGEHEISLTVTDADGLPATDVVDLSINAAPTTPGLEVSPRDPTGSDDVVVTLSVPSVDADEEPDPLEHFITWTRDGDAVPDLFGRWTLSDDLTAKGQEWIATVNGFDGQSRGPEASVSATIVNSLPRVDIPTLTPPVLAASSTAECTGLAGIDADDDVVTLEVSWWIDGVDIGVTGSTLAGAFAAGMTVQCGVTGHDGEEAGETALSEGVPVVNSLPGSPSVVVTPAFPGLDDPLDCSLAAPVIDADGQVVTYDATWTVDGAGTGISAQSLDEAFVLTVPATSTATGEGWTCEVISDDGTAQSSPGSTTVFVNCPLSSGTAAGCPGTSCQQLLDGGFSVGDGSYWLDPAGLGSGLFECDMTTDSGGWTGISFANADTVLGGAMVAVDAAGTAGIDPVDGPYTRDGGGDHTYHYTLDFPPAFEEFYLGGWVLKAWSAAGDTSDIYLTWLQTDWNAAFGPTNTGDVSFGDAAAVGPVASYGRVITSNVSCRLCTTAYPSGSTVYPVTPGATQFRLGWGEGGGQLEGWYPWWDGLVYLR